MGEVVDFTGESTVDIPADKVLENSIGKLAEVVVVGMDHDGRLYLASSSAELSSLLMLVKMAEVEIMAQAMDYEG